MTRRAWAAVVVTAGVVCLTGVLSYRAARQDRAALLVRFANDRLEMLHGEIRDLEVDLSDLDQHLQIAAQFLASESSPEVEKKELETVLAVVHTFEMMAIYDGEGRQRIVALDQVTPPPAGAASFAADLQKIAKEAIARGTKIMSPPLGGAEASCYRAFAAPIRREGRTDAVVLLVNLRGQFERVRVGVGGASATFVLVDGDEPPLILYGDPPAQPFDTRKGEFAELLRRMRPGESGTSMLADPSWTLFGLTTPDDVAAFAPLATGTGEHWGIAVVSSTGFLRAQEHAIALRTIVFGGTVVLAVVALATFFVVTARRTIAIREQLRSAEQLAHLREKAEKILENVPVGVIALEGGGRISAMNRASRAQVPPSALGGPVDGAFPNAPNEAVKDLHDLIVRAQSSGAVQSIIAEPLALSGLGTYFAVHAVPLAHPLPDLNTLLVFEDVTELRALASQLLRAEKFATVGVLAAGFAHEVGTPLGVVRGRAEMLASRLAPESQETRNAAIMVEEIDRISRTIRELLDFSRTSRAPAETQVRLDAVASNVAELLAFEARSRRVSIEVDVPSRLPALAANLDQLKQVLVNLTMNALHACAPGGQVTLRGKADPRAARAVIEVADNGAGIPDELRHRVFDPFFTTKKRGKGTGLGLTVAAQIVRNHGGEIDLDSAVGRGTRVVVTWPLASTAMEPMEPTDGQPEARAHPGGR